MLRNSRETPARCTGCKTDLTGQCKLLAIGNEFGEKFHEFSRTTEQVSMHSSCVYYNGNLNLNVMHLQHVNLSLGSNQQPCVCNAFFCWHYWN